MRTIINAKMKDPVRANAEPTFQIRVPEETTMPELEFVLARVMYNIVLKYMQANHVSFDEAMALYKEAIATDVGIIYDQEHPGDNHG